MRRFLCNCARFAQVAIICGGMATALYAQRSNQRAEAQSAPAPAPATPGAAVPATAPASYRLVAFDVVIAEWANSGKQRPALDMGATADVQAAIKELEKKGDIDVLTRVRITTVEQCVGSVQVGEQRSVPTGRNVNAALAGRGRGEGPMSYVVQDVGMVVMATPRVESDGSVIAELHVEQSRLAASEQKEDGKEGAGEATRPRMVTVNAKSTIRLPKGVSVVLGAAQSSGTEESRESIIVVSASVSPEGVEKHAAAEKPVATDEIKIFALRYANAKELAKIVSTVFSHTPMSISVDERTNSILVRGPHGSFEEIQAVLSRLDAAKEEAKSDK